jgi:outer membrane autotransporter protein
MIRTGTVGVNGYSGGAYWTHYGPSGWYIDAVIPGAGYDGSAPTQFVNLPLNGSGFVSSLEAGYPFPLPWFGPTFVLEPQAKSSGRSFRSARPTTAWVRLASVPSQAATGRLGLRGGGRSSAPTKRYGSPIAGQHLARLGRRGDHRVRLRGVPLIEQATRLEFAGGVTARPGPRLSLLPRAAINTQTRAVPTRTAATASRATSACGSRGDAAMA